MEEQMESNTNERIIAKREWVATQTMEAIVETLVRQDELQESWKENVNIATRQVYDLRDTVHTFFSDQFDGGDDSITITKEEANELLTNCGCDELESEFTVTLTVQVTLSVTAPNEDTAIDMAKDSLSVENDDVNVKVDDWEVTEDSAEKADY
jgi:hypothetical protein